MGKIYRYHFHLLSRLLSILAILSIAVFDPTLQEANTVTPKIVLLLIR